MPARFNSALLAIAAEFTGQHVPWQGVHVAPFRSGVTVSASDRGAVALIAYDPNGTADESLVLLPDSELTKACKGIKTAERDISLNGPTAVVTTYRKEKNTSVEVPVTYSSIPFPPLRQVLKAVIDHWSSTPTTSSTAGRYDSKILLSAFKAVATEPSLVISSFHGGPLRLQREDCELVIFAMPQTAEAIPPLPDWLCGLANADPS